MRKDIKVMEFLNSVPDSRTSKRRLRNIIKDMGDRHITLGDIHEGNKLKGFESIMSENNATLDEYMILGQYSKAILDQDTRAAEFLRDTAGEKPTLNVQTEEVNALEQMSMEQLLALNEKLEAVMQMEADIKDGSTGTVDCVAEGDKETKG